MKQINETNVSIDLSNELGYLSTSDIDLDITKVDWKLDNSDSISVTGELDWLSSRAFDPAEF